MCPSDSEFLIILNCLSSTGIVFGINACSGITFNKSCAITNLVDLEEVLTPYA